MHCLSLLLYLPLLTAVLTGAVPAASNGTALNETALAFEEDSKGGFDYCKYEHESHPKGIIRDDLLKGHCKGKKVLLLFARGSEEPINLGSRVGLPLSVAFAKELGEKNVAVQGVYKYDGYKYPATLKQAYNGGSTSGAQAFAHLIAKWKDTCAETKLVIGGYSQGAQIAHKAVGFLETDNSLKGKNLQKDIHGIILFGDPDKTEADPFPGVPNLKSKLIEDCHPKDDYCHGGGTFHHAHLTYCRNIAAVSHKAVKRFNL